MSGIVSGISHIFQAIFDLFRGTLNSVVWVIQNAVGLVVDLINSIISFFGGVVSFLLANVLTIAILAAAMYGYKVYQQNQGNKVGVKKVQ